MIDNTPDIIAALDSNGSVIVWSAGLVITKAAPDVYDVLEMGVIYPQSMPYSRSELAQYLSECDTSAWDSGLPL